MEQNDKALLESISSASKQFYSAGSTFSTLACAATVLIVWSTIARLYKPLENQFCGLVLSFLIVLAYAFVIPEPPGYTHQGKLRLTIAEAIFGFINSFIVFSTALGIKAL
ncbi:MAG TPA: hypothetical protein VGX03_17695 [Candidatus Binatia bacterium]|jgi:hypothetical protein|nr:hypothetical protein [Candidatus Binatia bacterium]